jgi:hypothetical protein
MSTVARRSTSAMLPPSVVLSDYGARVLAHGFPKEPRVTPTRLSFETIAKEDLDPCDFGYRVVTPPTEEAFVYTDSSSYTAMDTSGSNNEPVTTSTLGSIVFHDDMPSYAAQEVMAAQKEWDELMEVETTRPHFEYWKEDPYAYERPFTYRNFSAAVIDTHADDEEAVQMPDAA